MRWRHRSHQRSDDHQAIESDGVTRGEVTYSSISSVIDASIIDDGDGI